MLLWLHRAAELIHGNLVSFSLIIFCMKILLRGYSVMTPQSAKGCVGYLLHFFTTQEKHLCSCGNYGRRKEFISCGSRFLLLSFIAGFSKAKV